MALIKLSSSTINKYVDFVDEDPSKRPTRVAVEKIDLPTLPIPPTTRLIHFFDIVTATLSVNGVLVEIASSDINCESFVCGESPVTGGANDWHEVPGPKDFGKKIWAPNWRKNVTVT